MHRKTGVLRAQWLLFAVIGAHGATACSEDKAPKQSLNQPETTKQHPVIVDRAKFLVTLDELRRPIISNWSDLVDPVMLIVPSETGAAPGFSVTGYCGALVAVAAKVASKTDQMGLVGNQAAFARRSQLKVSIRLLPTALGLSDLPQRLVADAAPKEQSGLAADTAAIANLIAITRVRTRLDFGDAALVAANRQPQVEQSISTQLNQKTSELSQGGMVALSDVGDDLVCDLLIGKAKLYVRTEGRLPDLETRTTFMTASAVEQILPLTVITQIAPKDSDPYVAVRRSAVLADAYSRIAGGSLSSLGTERFVTLYRAIFEAESVSGLVAAIQQYGRAEAIARQLDRVQRTPQVVSFDEKMLHLEGAKP